MNIYISVMKMSFKGTTKNYRYKPSSCFTM